MNKQKKITKQKNKELEKIRKILLKLMIKQKEIDKVYDEKIKLVKDTIPDKFIIQVNRYTGMQYVELSFHEKQIETQVSLRLLLMEKEKELYVAKMDSLSNICKLILNKMKK